MHLGVGQDILQHSFEYSVIVKFHVNSRHRYPLTQGLDPRMFDADNNLSFEHSDRLSVVMQAQLPDCRCRCRHLENPPMDRINPWEIAMHGGVFSKN